MIDRRMLLFALNATAELGKAIAAALRRPLAAHEEREFEDGEHKARPLEAVRGADVFADPSRARTISFAGCCSLSAHSKMPGRRA
jgi:phosphoribosylpyrophosphate synthetase